MVSDNKLVMRCISSLCNQRDKVTELRRNLKKNIMDRYPADTFGIKGEMIYQEKAEKYDAEILLLNKYINGMYDLIEIIENKERVSYDQEH